MRVVVVRVEIVRVGDDRVVVAEIGVVGGSSSILHPLPMEELSATGSCFAFAGSTFSSDRPDIGILKVPMAVGGVYVAAVGWSVIPHLWGCRRGGY